MDPHQTLELCLRAPGAGDPAFLFALFRADRAAEFATLGLTSAQISGLLEMQFRARQQEYAGSFPQADDLRICLAEGDAVGRVLVDRQPDCLRIVDFAVLPAFRNRRVGAWTLHSLQLQAARAGLPLRLRVLRVNPALRLYRRQGFAVVAQDEVSYELEWRMLPEPAGLSHTDMLDRIVDFLREIGLRIDFAPLPSNTFLPGVLPIGNGLRIDVDRLLYPGDLLHEAGHLAVMPAPLRQQQLPEPTEMGEEIAATAWSYAAAVHLGLPTNQVIHDNGYRGAAANLREAFANGTAPGIALLDWMGLCHEPAPRNSGLPCFPHMLRWLRPASATAPESAACPIAELHPNTASDEPVLQELCSVD